MSEASRLETLEKNFAALLRACKDFTALIDENRQMLSAQEDQMQEFSNALAALENEVSFIKERVSGEPESSEADSPSETK